MTLSALPQLAFKSLLTIGLWGALSASLSGQEAQEASIRTAPTAPSQAPALLADDGSRVSVLGYHWFHATKPAVQMCMPTTKFREQMQAIKDSNIPVISMTQFLGWRRGELEIPPKSFLITMDDGWKSVYTQAFPILKELQMPFTVFLYKNYVGSNRGGRAMSIAMIQEMVESGLCTIGSHSVSHPKPGLVKATAKKGSDVFQEFLQTEFGESKRFLEETFGKVITTYAYPGGFYTDEMFPIADQLGYDHLFTVKPGKVRRDSAPHTLPRYIVLGNHDGPFNAAMIFRGGSHLIAASGFQPTAAPVILPHPTSPEPGAIVASRLPTISIDLTNVLDLDPDSVVMRVAGFDKVPIEMNPGTQIFQWTVSRPLRQAFCEVTAQWKLRSKAKYEPVMRWSFRLDREAAYQAN